MGEDIDLLTRGKKKSQKQLVQRSDHAIELAGQLFPDTQRAFAQSATNHARAESKLDATKN